jgi:hypothetical protein
MKSRSIIDQYYSLLSENAVDNRANSASMVFFGFLFAKVESANLVEDRSFSLENVREVD